MKKFLSLIVFLTIFISGNAQTCYWQQRAEYKMDIDMNTEKHQYQGTQKITYFNNSPDTLSRVFYHLYFNAFQPGSMMDVRSRTIEDPSPKIGDRISKLSPEEQGYIKVKSLKQDGTSIDHYTNGTILEVTLAKPILPGKKTVFEMTWDAQIPIQIRRSGRDNKEGVDYSMTQWYPQLCEYDYKGWHANPYIGREFYSIWSNFDVTIHLDEAYTIGGTGNLQNPNEIGHGYSNKTPKSKNGKLDWHFTATNVHDFAWAADTEYLHDVVKAKSGFDLHFIYLNNEEYIDNWKEFQSSAVKIFDYAEEHFGKYPFKQYTVIQGGDGGMEYPMTTLITGNRKLPSLIGVTAHEAMHTWYQMLLGTNESLYTFMDEGFTSYASARIMAHISERSEKSGDVHANALRGYINLATSAVEEPLSTHADHYDLNWAHSVAVYNKGEVFLTQLGYIIGEKALDRTLLRYYKEWRFKHPEPYDFLRIAEKESGLELDWYLEYFINSTKALDYSISSITSNGSQTEILISREDLMIMPMELEITYTDGTKELHYIPLRIMRGEKEQEYDGIRIVERDWPWTYPSFKVTVDSPISQIKSLELDPSKRLGDIDRENQYIEPNNQIYFNWQSK